jgi:hypothetical protein
MSIRTVDRRAPTLDACVIAWRRDQLLEVGFPTELARGTARERLLDLHALIELVERGCDPRLAVRILAPLDDEEDDRTRR